MTSIQKGGGGRREIPQMCRQTVNSVGLKDVYAVAILSYSFRKWQIGRWGWLLSHGSTKAGNFKTVQAF